MRNASLLFVAAAVLVGLLGLVGCSGSEAIDARLTTPSSEAASSTTVAGSTTSATSAAPSAGSSAETTIPAPESTTDASVDITSTTASFDLRDVDWSNRTYVIESTCIPAEWRARIPLVDGEADLFETEGLFYGLIDVVYGEMGSPPEPVAAVVIARVGASSFPTEVLLFSGARGSVDFLGIVAPDLVACGGADDLAHHDWSPDAAMIAGGRLTMTGEGWGEDAAHCCPDLAVVSVVILDSAGRLAEIEHRETTRDS